MTDGEFNSLCSKGSTRPLSIVQIRSECRKKYARMSESKMRGMLTITGKPGGDLVFIVFQMFKKCLYWAGISLNGTLLTKQHNPAVIQVMLVKIKALETQGKSFSEIIEVLRPTTVPQGYTSCWWREGMQ